MIKLERLITWMERNWLKVFFITVWIFIMAYIVYVMKCHLSLYKNKAKNFMFYATIAIIIVLIAVVTGATIVASAGGFI